ncbi:pathogenicity island 2 effector protein SseE [Salmonella enterica]|uniref:Pathogenicity island 2 effector protein SseE n=1 Tax=Salmonella enterica subsp. houtenae serovar 21:z4,z23:- TaxID=1967606 RepID=A0A752IP88_SALHO|nr:pathogenicity island 2 effector protein SseE [Salmonella enterica]EAA3678795.1 pathogenicity island 2 effector protein SseE [Salmonella enterica subsp. houtenae]EBR0110024.1 pathogenicity island 2 effector protein SseE [Salmonella enterica subsp. houtenae serovar Houten]EEC0940601.1 pathogenicity island 2 effector protein SseE [Salmonella enterica subsp. enterica serovar Baguida]HAF7510434.1 pathogenicity island 2 effector protein SseE [Salmonella enterica subsp. houtenae serovar 21:z4,z23:-
MVQEIEQWLRRHQVLTEPAYLGETSILLGQQFILSPYLVVYRIEAEDMIICEFRRLTPGQPQPQQLFHLLGLLRGIFAHHPQLKYLRMLVITDILDEKQAVLRRKLLRILTAMGATFTRLDGDNWTILSAEHLIQRRF